MSDEVVRDEFPVYGDFTDTKDDDVFAPSTTARSKGSSVVYDDGARTVPLTNPPSVFLFNTKPTPRQLTPRGANARMPVSRARLAHPFPLMMPPRAQSQGRLPLVGGCHYSRSVSLRKIFPCQKSSSPSTSTRESHFNMDTATSSPPPSGGSPTSSVPSPQDVRSMIIPMRSSCRPGSRARAEESVQLARGLSQLFATTPDTLNRLIVSNTCIMVSATLSLRYSFLPGTLFPLQYTIR